MGFPFVAFALAAQIQVPAPTSAEVPRFGAIMAGAIGGGVATGGAMFATGALLASRCTGDDIGCGEGPAQLMLVAPLGAVVGAVAGGLAGAIAYDALTHEPATPATSPTPAATPSTTTAATTAATTTTTPTTTADPAEP